MRENDLKVISMTGGGEPPVDDRLENRVNALEDDTRKIKTDVAVIRSNYVTREDLQREVGRLREDLQREVGSLKESIEKMGRVMIMWSAGSMLTVATLALAFLRYMS